MQQYEVEAILSKRFNRHRCKTEYLVKWKHYPFEDSSWEPIQNLKNSQQFVKQYQSQITREKLISVVQVPLEKEKQNSNGTYKQPIDVQENGDEYGQKDLQNILKKYKKTKQIQKKRRERQRQRNHQNRQTQQRQLSEQSYNYQIQPQAHINRIEVLDMTVKNEKTYFKIVQNGQKIWRNRNYLTEFYPQQLCSFYEKMVLNKKQKQLTE